MSLQISILRQCNHPYIVNCRCGSRQSHGSRSPRPAAALDRPLRPPNLTSSVARLQDVPQTAEPEELHQPVDRVEHVQVGPWQGACSGARLPDLQCSALRPARPLSESIGLGPDCAPQVMRLSKSFKGWSDQHVKFILYQTLCGMQYLHSANIVHRDLKPSNLLGTYSCAPLCPLRC